MKASRESILAVTVDIEDWYHVPMVTGSPLARYRTVDDFFEEHIFDKTIPQWPSGKELEFQCPRFHKEEKEYLITIRDINKKILSKVVKASDIMK